MVLFQIAPVLTVLLKSTPARLVLVKLELVKFVFWITLDPPYTTLKSVAVKLAPVKSAFDKFIPSITALEKFAEVKSAFGA